MKRCVLICVLFLAAAPLWAGYDLSNTVTREIHRGPVIEEVQDEPLKQPAPGKTVAAVSPAKTVFYPYTIHLSSWQDPKEAYRQIEKMQARLDTLFITKIDLGASGIWHRIDHGLFPTIKDAVARLRELKARNAIDKGAFVGGQVAYGIELGTYESVQEANDEARELKTQGMVPYVIREQDAVFRLLLGAYPDEKSAAPAMEDLKALGFDPTFKKR